MYSDTAQQSCEMRNAVRILKTGLLHVGFKNFTFYIVLKKKSDPGIHGYICELT